MRTKTITDEGRKYLAEFLKFKEDRPAVEVSTLIREAGLGKKVEVWLKILRGDRTLTPYYFDEYKRIREEMKKYGF